MKIQQDMGLETILTDEEASETMKFIESKRNWDVTNQRYRKPEAEKCKANLAECKIYKRGKYFILEHDDIIHYWEHEGNYCYFEDALQWMKPEKPTKWKTLDKFITFRQAIRECTAQGMGLEDLYQIEEGISFEQYKEFIKVARVFDKRHHGSVTF